MTIYADRTLVVHASSGGSTKAVAEFIAARLRVQGAVADVRGLDERPGLDGYDAVVLGSAVRSGALLPAAEHFVLQNTDALRVMPVWLFSLGSWGCRAEGVASGFEAGVAALEDVGGGGHGAKVDAFAGGAALGVGQVGGECFAE